MESDTKSIMKYIRYKQNHIGNSNRKFRSAQYAVKDRKFNFEAEV